MQKTHTASFGVIGRAVPVERRESRSFFAGFTFDGDQRLKTLVAFYGLPVPVREPGVTLAEYLARNCYGSPRPGYRVALGGVELIVTEMEEGAITKVGLRLFPPASRQRRRRWPSCLKYALVSDTRPGPGLPRLAHGAG